MSKACAPTASPEAAPPKRYPGWRPGYGDGYRGGPGRTSPRRAPRPFVATAAMAAVVAAAIVAEPGSRFDIARPRTKISAIHSAIPLPAHLKGALFEVTEKADLDSCVCQWFSYEQLAFRLECDRRTAINYVASLESWGLVKVEPQPRFTDAGDVYHQPCKITVQIPPWLEPAARPPSAASMSPPAPPTPPRTAAPVDDAPSGEDAVDAGTHPSASSPATAAPPPPPEQVKRVHVALSACCAAADLPAVATIDLAADLLACGAKLNKGPTTIVNAIRYVDDVVRGRKLEGPIKPSALGELLYTNVRKERIVPEPEPSARKQTAGAPLSDEQQRLFEAADARRKKKPYQPTLQGGARPVHPARRDDWDRLDPAMKAKLLDEYDREESWRPSGAPP